MTMVIDCHGHYTTAPAPLQTWRQRQVSAWSDGTTAPLARELSISDEELRESIAGSGANYGRERKTAYSP